MSANVDLTRLAARNSDVLRMPRSAREARVSDLVGEARDLLDLAIEPYPVLDEPDHHDHHGDPDERGWVTVTRVEGRESDCPTCTEPAPTPEDTNA